MHVCWYGQSAFLLSEGERRLMIDPFGDGKALAGRGLRFQYPQIGGVDAELLLITHEHSDHNNAAAVAGEPHVIRAAVGRFDTPFGEVVGIASEHDVQIRRLSYKRDSLEDIFLKAMENGHGGL